MEDCLKKRLDQAWAGFAAGAAPGKSRFSMVQLATLGLDGAPKLRTVVLRRADADQRLLSFNTDRRAPKCAEIRAEPRVTILGYDMEAGLQIRAEGRASLVLDGAAFDAAWAAALPRSRICYRGDYGPGSAIAAPEEADPTSEAQAPQDPDWGREAFAIVDVDITRIDLLDLAVTGHRRAVFDWGASGWTGAWVAP